MTTRSYTNTLLLEGALDAISPSASFARLADQVMQPSVEIVEEDCGTLLGERVLLAYDYTGRIPAGSSTPLTAAAIEAAVNAGEPYMRLRSTSTCVSDGGVCKLCFRSTSPELGNGVGAFDPVSAPNLYSRAAAISQGSTVDDLYVVSGADVPALATVQVYLNGVLNTSTTADALGAWITPPIDFLPAGTYGVTYRVTSSGVTGASSPTVSFSIRDYDQYDSLVTLYLTGQGPAGANILTSPVGAEIVENLSPYVRTGTTSASSTAKYSLAGNSKFGGTSFEFTAGTGSRVFTSVKSYLDDIGNCDFTVEFQIKPKALGGTMVVAQQATGTGNYAWQIIMNADGTITFNMLGLALYGGTWSVTSTAVCPAGQWTYVRASKVSRAVRIQVGDAAVVEQGILPQPGTTNVFLWFNYLDSVILGGYSTTEVASLDAYLGHFRITRGVARTGPQPATAFPSSRPARAQVEKIRETFTGASGTSMAGAGLDLPTASWVNAYGAGTTALYLDGAGQMYASPGQSSTAYSISSTLGAAISSGTGWEAVFVVQTPPYSASPILAVPNLEIRLDSAGNGYWYVYFDTNMAAGQELGADRSPNITQDYPPGGELATVRIRNTGTGRLISTMSWGNSDADPLNGEVKSLCATLESSYTSADFDQLWITMKDPGMKFVDFKVTTQAWTNPILPGVPPSTPGTMDVVANVGDVLPAESAYVLDTQVLRLTSPTSAVDLKNPQNSFYKLRVYVDGKLKPSTSYAVSGSDLTLYTPATSQIVIKYVSNTRTPFFYDLAAKYFGSLMGVRPLSVVRLPLKKTLYEQLTPKEDIDELVEKLRNTDAPPEAVEYLVACKSPLEKSIGALLLASLFMQ